MKGSTGAKTGVLALILALLPTILSAAVVRISWNANTESDLEGYRVFYGTSHGNYPRVINVGRRTAIDVSGLSAGGTYFFAVTAYDFSGNESAYSLEASVTIPAQDNPPDDGGESPAPDPPDDGGLLDDLVDLVDWLEDIVRDVFGLDPEVPVFALGNFGAVDRDDLPHPAGSVIAPVSEGGGAGDYSVLFDLYPVRDAVFLTATPFDLASLYPDGAYLFYPLDGGCPEIDGDTIVAGEPGSFLYVVFGDAGTVDHILRLSVAQDIYQISMYNPATTQFIEDIVTGIAIDLPYGATVGPKPVAIGWGGFEAFPGAALLAPDPNAFFFDILPYGLELLGPAVVSLPYAGTEACVERYDEYADCWVKIEDAQVIDGYLSFSAQTLGRFKVSLPSGAVSEDAPFERQEESCFVGAAGISPSSPALAVILMGALVFLGLVTKGTPQSKP